MSHITTSAGHRLRYVDRGAGPPLVLVHGWKGSHRVWEGVVDRLADRFRIVAFDLRGMGESDKPDGRYDFDELSDDLAEVLETLALDGVTVVAWSMGCTVALEYLRRRGDAAVDRLVLMSGPIRLTQTPDFPWTMTEQRLRSVIAHIEEGWPIYEREFVAGYLREPRDEVVDWLYEIALQTPVEIALATVRAQAKLDFRAFLPKLTMPVLAVYGAYDRAYPTELAEYIARSVPHGDHAIFEASAHMPFLEEPARFTDALAEFATR